MLIKRLTSTGSNDLQVAFRPYQIDEMIGSVTNKRILKNNLDNLEVPHSYLFTGPYGCVDCDTEFLTPTGWKKISAYKEGDLVLQYNSSDTTANFVVPNEYIKRKSDASMFHFKTKYGLDQCLSDDHNVYYVTRKGKKHTIPFNFVRRMHEENSAGFEGRFFTSFSIDTNTAFPLSDEELRVQVMVIADGTFPEGRQKCGLNLKKKRKIKRAEELLNAAKIPFEKYEISNDYTRFYFVAPIRTKYFTSDFYTCSKVQLELIASEVLLWDGDQNKMFYSTVKESADFIQYVFVATNIKASINIDDRKGKSLTYRVIKSSTNLSGISPKTVITPHLPVDGYQYCFIVPSGYLVLRRNNCVFITGNCGKTTAARVLAVGLNCEEGVSSKPCLKCDSCKSIINQNSMDVIEVNVGQSNKKGDTEKIVEGLMSAPFNSRYIVLIMDETHKLTPAAQELLLKIIEDGYAHVYFIFCTNEPEKLKETFISRCNVLNFGRMSYDNIFELLTNVCEYEAIEYNKEVLEYLATECKGVPRDALVWLKQLNDEGSWTLEVAKEISGILLDEDNPKVIELCRALIGRKFKDALMLYKKLNMPPENVRMAVAGYFTNCLKGAKAKGDARRFSDILDVVTVPIYDPGKLGEHKIVNYFFKVTDMGS